MAAEFHHCEILFFAQQPTQACLPHVCLLQLLPVLAPSLIERGQRLLH